MWDNLSPKETDTYKCEICESTGNEDYIELGKGTICKYCYWQTYEEMKSLIKGLSELEKEILQDVLDGVDQSK